jgi:hypothetical protein
LTVLGELFRKEFQCHVAMELPVLGLVDDTHAPATELFQNAIVADYAANHARKPSLTPILGHGCS